MKCFYHVSSAVFDAVKPRAGFHAQPSVHDPTLTLVVVEEWPNYAAQDEWEALPGVTCYPIWEWSKPAPLQMIAAHVKDGAMEGESVGQVMERIRKTWPAVRP